MKFSTMKQLEKAMEQARLQGFAVIGFAVKPDDGGMIKLDNQNMDKEQFTAMMSEALSIFTNHTDSDVQAKLIIN